MSGGGWRRGMRMLVVGLDGKELEWEWKEKGKMENGGGKGIGEGMKG